MGDTKLGIGLDDLGISTEDIINRVVDAVADRVISAKTVRYNSKTEGYDECTVESEIHDRIHEEVSECIAKKAEEVVAAHVMPRVGEMVENLTLQATDEWGRAKKGAVPVSFPQYLIAMARRYWNEEVDYQGKTRDEVESYNRRDWKSYSTRAVWVASKHVHGAVQNAMAQAVDAAQKTLMMSIQEAASMKLAELAQSLQIVTEPKAEKQ